MRPDVNQIGLVSAQSDHRAPDLVRNRIAPRAFQLGLDERPWDDPQIEQTSPLDSTARGRDIDHDGLLANAKR